MGITMKQPRNKDGTFETMLNEEILEWIREMINDGDNPNVIQGSIMASYGVSPLTARRWWLKAKNTKWD